MFCDEVLDAVEPIAAGELTPDGRVADHLATCPNCASVLESAKRLEQMLQARPAPKTPLQFTPKTIALVRRRRWRSEQFLDAGFNVALGLAALAIVGAIWVVLNRSGLVTVGNGAVDLLGVGLAAAARKVTASVPLYAGATALLASALGVWWWAERDATL